jgi:uncharacterized phage protein gp47/JayE
MEMVWLLNQMLADTMDEDRLIAAAAEKGVPRIPGNLAAGQIEVSGAVGAVVPRDAILIAANRAEYRVTSPVTIQAATAIVEVQAMDIGRSANLDAGTPLVFVSPEDGVQSNAVVMADAIAGGADIEPIARLRERYKERLRNPPQGGKPYDYVAWAKAAHVDVTKVWVTEHEGQVGRVVVRFVTEGLNSPIPTQAHIDTVAAYIEQKRPAGVGAFAVLAPVALSLNLEFTSLSPNTDAVKAEIDAELDDYLVNWTRDENSEIPITHINAAISNAPSEYDHALTQNQNVAVAVDQYPVRGNTQWP